MNANLNETSYNELFFEVSKSFKNLFIDLVFELGIEAIEEREKAVFIRSFEDLSQLVFALESFALKLSKNNYEPNFSYKLSQKACKDYISEYQNSIKPLKIGEIYIHTSWQKPLKNAINICIDPALAFGSGHHESTNACIELLQKYAKKGQNALDVGCGSGILSIILAKLGCKVSACDSDEIAISSTLKNAKLNEVSLEKIWQGSLDKNKQKFDLIVANLTFDIILSLKNELEKALKKGAFLILSGILLKYKEHAKEAFQSLSLKKELVKNEWLSIIYQK